MLLVVAIHPFFPALANSAAARQTPGVARLSPSGEPGGSYLIAVTHCVF